MGWTRHAGAVVSLAALASVVANYAIHRHFESRVRQLLVEAQREPSNPTEALVFDVPDFSAAAVPSRAPRQLDDLTSVDRHGRILPALQTSESSESTGSARVAPKPEPVPVPNDAAPIHEGEARKGHKTSPSEDEAVRGVIEDELSGSSREERDIWFDELKSLPAGVVRDLLQVRKQLRTLPRALQQLDIANVPPAIRVAEVPASPAGQTLRLPSPDWMPTLATLEQASAMARHNLANSTTPGFKRFRVFMVDNYGTNWTLDGDTPGDGVTDRLSTIQVEGSRLAPAILDLEQGSLQQTDRPLDLAIDGGGFFVAMVNEQTVYTRCGAMVLDSQRRICLAAVDAPAVLQPVMTIPADAREIQISAQGQVSVLRKLGADPEPAGQLQLARFASPARLRPIGGTLLVPTSASGAAEVNLPDEGGRGIIQQGCLEQSNADPETELSELNQWQSLLKMLPTVNRPVTARGSDPASR